MKKQLSILQTFLVTCLLLVIGGGSSFAQDEVIIWSEDWTGCSTGQQPSVINAMYSQTDNSAKSKTKIYNEKYAGGTAPELLVTANGSWTVNISDLKGCYGNVTLSFLSNKTNLSVKANGTNVSLTTSDKQRTGTFFVPKGTTSLTIVFSATENTRIDNVVLKGTDPNVKTFKFSATTCTAMLDATNNEFPTLTNDYGTPVTYSSSNPAVASVLDKDGTLNLNGIGKTIITATLDEDDKVTASYELTVNQKTTDVVFDFTAKPNEWGITPTSDNSKSNTDGKDLYVEGVKLNTTSGTGTAKTCIFSSSSSPTPNLRVYSGGSLTFTAPLGYNISKIVFTGSASFSPSDGNGTFSDMTWTDATNGSDKVVILKRSTAKTEIKTASVSLVKVTNAESISLPATNNDGTYATFSCSRDVIFTEDVIVNAVKVEDGSLVITPLTTDIYETSDAKNSELIGYYVPANTGVLISGIEKNAQVYYPAANQSVTIDNNQLKPAPINGGMIEAVDGNKYYKLAYYDYTNNTGLGFYWGEKDGGAFKVKSGTAYLEVPVTSSSAKGFAFVGDETGITNIDANSSNSRVIYNLAGQRMSDTVKPGLYIINGKKTVVR